MKLIPDDSIMLMKGIPISQPQSFQVDYVINDGTMMNSPCTVAENLGNNKKDGGDRTATTIIASEQYNPSDNRVPVTVSQHIDLNHAYSPSEAAANEGTLGSANARDASIIIPSEINPCSTPDVCLPDSMLTTIPNSISTEL